MWKKNMKQVRVMLMHVGMVLCMLFCSLADVAFGGIDTKAPHDIYTAANLAQRKTTKKAQISMYILAINCCSRCCCNNI